MENASKALLIAVAVLVTIIIITVGIKIYTSSSGTDKVATDTGQKISEKTEDATDLVIGEITGNKNGTVNFNEKTAATVIVGDDISIGEGDKKQEFKVISNNGSQIKAIPFYNITLTDKPEQSISTTETRFADNWYWSSGGSRISNYTY